MAGGFVGQARVQVQVQQVTGAGRRALHQFGGMSEVNAHNITRGHNALEILRADTDKLLVESLRRPSQSTGHLRRTIHDPRNSYVTATEFGLGRESFLDSSYAKYWRQIEEGYSGHVGKQLRFLLDNRGASGTFTAGGRRKSKSSDYPSRGRSATQDPGIRMASSGSKGRWDQRGLIRRPIHAHEYYSRAARGKREYIRRTLSDMARDHLMTAGFSQARYGRSLRG